MSTKYFIGLTFFSDNSFAKHIESYRSRFDTKYETNPYLHLPIVPPFELEPSEIKKLKQELVEEVESFYFENLENHALSFSGLDVYEHKKDKIIYLNHVVDEELLLCQESLFAICQSYITDREKKMKAIKKNFLAIGRFLEPLELHTSIYQARLEFQEFTTLAYETISLFSKKNGIWYREAALVTFKKPASFLQSSIVSPII
jgi:hypothetical protein